MELASSDAAAILFFLYKEKEKNGGAKRADRVVRPYKRYGGNRRGNIVKYSTVSNRERQTRPPDKVVPLVYRFFNFYLQKRSF